MLLLQSHLSYAGQPDIDDVRHHICIGGTGEFVKRVYCHEVEKRTEEHGVHRNGPPGVVAIAEVLQKLPSEAREGLEIASRYCRANSSAGVSNRYETAQRCCIRWILRSRSHATYCARVRQSPFWALWARGGSVGRSCTSM